MVIITDASGNIQAPTIPDNVQQGSNLANEIVFLAPLAQSNSVVITFRKPNGVLIEELPMTPYTSVPSEYNLSAWRYVLEDVITELYGQVTFQIKVRNGQGTVITSVGGTFPVLRGVPSIPSSNPSESKWQAILDYVASIQADIDNGWLEARGLLPYHENFEYSIGASVFDKATASIYTSLISNNVGNPLSDTTKWGKTGIYNGTNQDIEEMIDDAITTHNSSETAHQDIRNLIAGKQDGLSQAQLDAVNSGIDSTKVAQIETNKNNIIAINEKIPEQASADNQLADKNFVNSSINNNAAYYITYNAQGEAFPTKSALINATTFYSGGEVRTPTRNDYCIVRADETQDNATTRYSYQNNQWEFQYVVNETPMTAAQVAAINSGITNALVAQITTNQNDITALQSGKQNVLTAGANITISGDTISATDITYSAGTGIVINGTTIEVDTDTVQSKLTFDNTPTQNSTNPVTSGGVKSYVDNIVGDIETLLGGI